MTQMLEILVRVIDQATAEIKAVAAAVNTLAVNMNVATAASFNLQKGFKLMGDHVMNTQRSQQRFFDSYGAGMKNATKLTGDLTKSIGKTRGQVIGLGMSILFSGMALARLGQNTLNTFFNTSKIAGSEMTAFNVKTQELLGAWEFLKFTIADTFGRTEAFANFVEFFVNIVNLISEFVQKNPEVAILVAAFATAAVSLGSIAMALGQIYLLAYALELSLGVTLAIIAILALAFAAVVLLWTSDVNIVTKIIGTIAIALLAIGAIMLLVGGVLAIPFIIFGLLLGALAIAIGIWGDRAKITFMIVVTAIGGFFKELWLDVMIGLAKAMNFILDEVQMVINAMDGIFSRIGIDVLRDLSVIGFKIDVESMEIDRALSAENTNRKILDLIDELQAFDQAKAAEKQEEELEKQTGLLAEINAQLEDKNTTTS